VTSTERLRIAVFIDFDNIEIGVKNTLNASFDAGLILEALKERGDVVSKMAYSDWQRAGGYSRALTQHAIRMVQRNLTPGGDKNGADINLALDALEMAFTHPHINAFVIVGGDSDFISLVEKLKQYDKKVFVVGGKQFTSVIMQRNCHEFIDYDNLIGQTQSQSGARRQQGGRDQRRGSQPIAQAVPLVTRALTVLSEREGAPPLGLLKTTLLQLDSTFDERSYGAGSFRDFAQKLEKLGVVRVQQGRGGWVVQSSDTPAAAPEPTAADASPAPSSAASSGPAGPAPAILGSPADGVQEFIRVLEASGLRRWPLYLRHIKQALRQSTPPFDERAYGFAQLTDIVRAAQKDGLLRMERDRQGVVRVFQGPAFGTTTRRPVPTDTEGSAVSGDETSESFGNEAEPAAIDTTEAPAIEPVQPEPEPLPEAASGETPAAPRRRRASRGGASRRRTPKRT
jgi:uncharacterized LabA/DUF88 family protein